MDFDEYKEKAMATNFTHEMGDKCDPLLYYTIKLNGEAGEIAEKVGKLFRDRKGEYDLEWVIDLKYEIGDVLWYLAALANHFDLSLDLIAAMNLDKLASRRERGKLGGDGDKR